MKYAAILLFVLSCKSIPLTEKMLAQKGENAQAIEAVNRSDLSPTEKKRVIQAIKSTEKLAETTDKENTKLEQKVGALAKYKWYFFGTIISAIAAIAVFLHLRPIKIV